MKMNEIIKIAKQRNITFKPGMSKEKLIRTIQANEGNQPCFRSTSVCDENGCLWMADCIDTRKVVC